jgi:hypothetical protein
MKYRTAVYKYCSLHITHVAHSILTLSLVYDLCTPSYKTTRMDNIYDKSIILSTFRDKKDVSYDFSRAVCND